MKKREEKALGAERSRSLDKEMGRGRDQLPVEAGLNCAKLLRELMNMSISVSMSFQKLNHFLII